MPSTDPRTACALYVRRSSAAGNGSNQSLAEQEAETRGLAARLGLDVVHVYAEREGTGASTRSRKRRPAWDAALVDLTAGDRFRTLVVYALDRADRRGAGEVAALLDRHADGSRRIVGVDGLDTSDPRRRLEFIIRAEVAREEAERIADRVTRTKRHRRADGRWLGGKPPYGTRVVDGRLGRDPETYPTARRIADALLAGETLWAVSAMLNREGVPAPSVAALLARAERVEDPTEAEALHARAVAARWRAPSIAAIVKAPGFAGLQSIRKRTASGGWAAVADVFRDASGEPVLVGEGVITRQERALILSALSSRTVERFTRDGRVAFSGNRVAGGASLLADVLRCPSCGGRAGLSGGPNARRYRCAMSGQGGGACEGFSASCDVLDGFIAARIVARLGALEPEPGEGWHPALVAAARVWSGEESPEVRAARKAAEALLAEAREEDARIVAYIRAGAFLPEEAAAERVTTRARILRAEEALAAIGSGEPDPAALLDAANTTEAWEALDHATRRRVVGALVARVVVSKARARGVRFDAFRRVSIEWTGEDDLSHTTTATPETYLPA